MIYVIGPVERFFREMRTQRFALNLESLAEASLNGAGSEDEQNFEIVEAGGLDIERLSLEAKKGNALVYYAWRVMNKSDDSNDPDYESFIAKFEKKPKIIGVGEVSLSLSKGILCFTAINSGRFPPAPYEIVKGFERLLLREYQRNGVCPVPVKDIEIDIN